MSARISKKEWVQVVAMCVAFYVVYVVSVSVYVAIQSPSQVEVRSLKAAGSRLVEELSRYKAAHGVYPPGLPASKLEAGRFGEWQYECLDQCMEFRLEVGNYTLHVFGLWYDSREPGWQLDT